MHALKPMRGLSQLLRRQPKRGRGGLGTRQPLRSYAHEHPDLQVGNLSTQLIEAVNRLVSRAALIPSDSGKSQLEYPGAVMTWDLEVTRWAERAECLADALRKRIRGEWAFLAQLRVLGK